MDIDGAVAWIAQAGLVGNLRLVQALLDQADVPIKDQEKVANILGVEPLEYGKGY